MRRTGIRRRVAKERMEADRAGADRPECAGRADERRSGVGASVRGVRVERRGDREAEEGALVESCRAKAERIGGRQVEWAWIAFD